MKEEILTAKNEIKQECEKMYLQIKQAEDRLKEIRSVCKHPNTFVGFFSWRTGTVVKGEICSDCGTFIKEI
jgi:hypothetical protein